MGKENVIYLLIGFLCGYYACFGVWKLIDRQMRELRKNVIDSVQEAFPKGSPQGDQAPVEK